MDHHHTWTATTAMKGATNYVIMIERLCYGVSISVSQLISLGNVYCFPFPAFSPSMTSPMSSQDAQQVPFTTPIDSLHQRIAHATTENQHWELRLVNFLYDRATASATCAHFQTALCDAADIQALTPSPPLGYLCQIYINTGHKDSKRQLLEPKTRALRHQHRDCKVISAFMSSYNAISIMQTRFYKTDWLYYRIASRYRWRRWWWGINDNLS